MNAFKKILSVKAIVATAIGAALFFALGMLTIPTPIPNTTISLQYGIQSVFAVLFGPVAGVLIGFLGHMFTDMVKYGPWWSWIISSAVVGLIIGLGCNKLDLENFGWKQVLRFNIVQAIAHLVAWVVVAPVLDILIYSEPANKVFVQGLVAGASNIVTTGIVGSLLLLAYSKTIVKRGSLKKEA